jgi:dTDP-4-amino-4,6-dideoxygalactose transaminase
MNHIGKAEKILTGLCGGKAFLTPSCTAALEISCLLTLSPGDEVIMPSWAFPSCANAIILRGAVPVFVDVDEYGNMTPEEVAVAISPQTKAIMPLHYAGVVSSQMRIIIKMAREHGLYVIEDAAQAINNWKVQGDIGCLSFHYTKNIQCGQGGAIIVNNPSLIERVERAIHCGTDKLKYYRGEQDYYNWLEVGSQQVISEYQAAVLVDELERVDEITARRKMIWDIYSNASGIKRDSGNGHFFWFLTDNKWDEMDRLKEFGIKVSSHFEALHLTPPGMKHGVSHACPKSLMFEQQLLKLDTSVSTEEAEIAGQMIWQSSIGGIRSIH